MKNKRSKYLFPLLLPLLALAADVHAQNAAGQAGEAGFYQGLASYLLLGFTAIVLIATIATLYRLLSMMIKVQQIRIYQERGLTEYLEEIKKPKPSPLKALYQRWTASVPLEKEEDILFDHEYDGIRELDNVLPPWWVALFYITIGIAVIYIGYYHVFGKGMTSTQAYEYEVKEAEQAVNAYLATRADQVDENTVEALTDPSQVALGQSIFQNKCTPCHGPDGGGNTIGPNLTDQYWIHGGGIKNVFRTIKYGVPEKGMISWQTQLTASDMQKVASFVWSLQGSTPTDPKAPQGDLWQPETTAAQAENVAQDTTAAAPNN